MSIFDPLKTTWNYIRKSLLFIGKVNSIILLTIFYFLILGPIAIIFQIVTNSSINKKRVRSYWRPYKKEKETQETLLRQF